MLNQDSRVKLVDSVICPYCWNQFPPEDVYWIAKHSELMGDTVAGTSEAHRFLPSRFTIAGNAIDEKGNICEEIACPVCHGQLPKAILEMPPLCFSVMGAPGSGKSFFLGAMLERMETVFSNSFGLELESVAPKQNRLMIGYQRALFEYDDPDEMKTLDKTQMQGVKGLYREVYLNNEDKVLSIPCMFSIRPGQIHPLKDEPYSSRLLCLYDCAGEYFEPESSHTGSLVVNHLERSDMLLFVFDPFKESKFRRACEAFSEDPQVVNERYRMNKKQSGVLSYAADMIRNKGNHPSGWKYDRPLIVLVNKFDGWKGLLGEESRKLKDVMATVADGLASLDIATIREVSRIVRQLLVQYSSSVVVAAESFAEEVLYVPASSTGVSPQVIDSQSGMTSSATDSSGQFMLGFRAGDLSPFWTEVPLLLALARRNGQSQSLVSVQTRD